MIALGLFSKGHVNFCSPSTHLQGKRKRSERFDEFREKPGQTDTSTSSDTPRQTATSTSSDTPRQTADSTSSDTPRQTAGSTSSDTPRQTADSTSSDTPRQIAGSMSSDTPRQTVYSPSFWDPKADSFLTEYEEFSETYLGRQFALRVQRNQIIETWEDS